MKYEKCNVVMLPTEKASSIWKDKEEGEIQYGDCHPDNPDWVAQHLYITNPNEEIKEDDYYLSSVNQYEIIKYDGKGFAFRHGNSKIIATTDKSLLIRKWSHGMEDTIGLFPTQYILPRPSNEFLKKYCELGGIDKVLVGYNSKCNDTMFCELPCSMDFIDCNHLKVDPDNTITIKTIKDSWDKKEVIELCELAYNKRATIQKGYSFEKWVKENL